MMFLNKVQSSTVVLLFAGLLFSGLVLCGLGALADPTPAQQPAAPQGQTRAKPQPMPKPIGPGTLLLARENDLVSLTPDGKTGDQLSAPKDTRTTRQCRLSPDGIHAAFVVSGGKPRGPGDDLDAPWPIQVVIRKLGTSKSKIVDFPGFGVDLCWAPDGKRLAVTRFAKDQSSEAVLLDPESGKKASLDLPAGARVLDWSREGETFLVVYLKDKRFRLGLASKDEKEARELAELKVRFANSAVGRFSPDGRKVLFTDADPEKKDAHKWHRSSQPHILDIASKKRQPLAEFPDNAQCLSAAWSPDGKRVAYTWTQLHPEVLKKDRLGPNDVAIQTEAFLIVADADGKNAKTVASGKSNQALNAIYGSIDWR